MTVTIYHNPACGTSRNTLEMIRQSGEEPVIIEYLKTPPSRQEIVSLADKIGVTLREILREKARLTRSSVWRMRAWTMRSCWMPLRRIRSCSTGPSW